jgi:SAM-dependent methyltransferase
MIDKIVRFDDGAAYERMMGIWSRRIGEEFLDWLNLPTGLKCVDVGCGNGAFTELLVERCRPAEVQGIDPSPQQIEFARKRHSAGIAEFRQADAMALPFPDNRFDAATMALVIFFVPEPAQGVAEMARVVRPGGVGAAYAWDMEGGGFPMTPILAEVRALGKRPRARRVSKPLVWILCASCGATPAWKPWRHARSPCSGHLLILKTCGPQVRGLARFARPLKRCRPAKRKRLKRVCARRFLPMQKAASRKADLPTQ